MPAVPPGEGATTFAAVAPDDAGDEDLAAGGPPLPPDDRLWRHPSELGLDGRTPAIAKDVGRAPRRPTLWMVAAVASLAGATLSTGVIAATRSLDRRVVERSVVEKVALTPVVSSPMMPGELGVAAVTERLVPAVVRIETTRPEGAASGSGVIFRDDGLVLASAHVVDNARTIHVDLADGRRVRAALVGVDSLTGIALIDIDGDGFPVAVLGSAKAIKIGAPAVAIGSPPRSDEGAAVITGVISALDRRVAGPEAKQLHGMIQIDASTDAGSSGGALVDEQGAVIGILSSVADAAGDRYGYATPIDLARRVAEQLLKEGKVTHCWLGVEGRDLSAEDADELRLAAGAVVERVAVGSPAEDAGLTSSDIITEIDGVAIRSISHLVLELRSHTPGDRVVLGFWRDGRHVEIPITLVARP